MHTLANFADGWTLRLLAASLQGAALAAAVGLLCRWMPSLSAATRSRLWWLVCAQMLLGLLWPDAMKLHPLHQQPVSPAMALAMQQQPATPEAIGTAAPAADPQGIARAQADPVVRTVYPVPRRPGWRTLLLLVWAAGTATGLLLLAREYRVHGRRLRRSRPAGADLRQLLEQEARTVGLREVPELRLAPDIRSPQVIGLRRPTVLMPEQDLSAWHRGDLVMALRHECLHLRHHDLWWAWGPVLAQRLFFFNPVAAMAAREFALAREAAVDEALLRQPDVSAHRYGELLLRLGVSSSGVTAMATASPSFRILHRRLTMMNALSTRGRAANAAGTLALLLVAGASLPLSATPTTSGAVPAIPVAPAVPLVAAAALPAAAAPAAPAVAATPAAPAVAATPAAPAVPATPASAAVAARLPAPSAAPPAPAAAPAVPAPAAAPGRHVHTHSSSHSSTYVFDDSKGGTSVDIDDADEGGAQTRIIVSHDGQTPQIIKITREPGSNASQIWYDDGSKHYVIDDAAILAKVTAALESTMKSFGEQQGKLGEQQGLLGGKQAELGAEQERLGSEEARLAQQLQEAARKSADEKVVDELERQQDELGRRQDEIGEQQDELGKAQDELGRQQDELGKRQDQAAREITDQIRQIMKQAVASGLARQEKS